LTSDAIYRSWRFIFPALLLWFGSGSAVALLVTHSTGQPVTAALLMILPSLLVAIILSITGR